MESLYDILGVDTEADNNDLKKAYYRLAQIHHPDHGGDAELFKRIKSAYKILSDEDKRKLYDECDVALEDSDQQVKFWVKQTMIEIITAWLNAKLNSPRSTPKFNKYMSNKIHENRVKAKQSIKDCEQRITQARKYMNFAEISSDDENVFIIAIQRIINDIEYKIEEGKIFIYKTDMLEKEFKKYKFNEMDEYEVVQFVNLFGTDTNSTFNGYGGA